MTDNSKEIQDVVASMNMTKVLVALLEEYGKLTIPTLKFLDVTTDNKELVVDYDEENPSFTFSIKQSGNTNDRDTDSN
jgi:hypothetical protein